jgi:hypothetical protein
MNNVGHKRLHKFTLKGKIFDEKYIPRLKDQYVDIVVEYMGYKGYIPQLDLNPTFTVQFNKTDFDFQLTIHGVFIGRAKARCYQAAYGTQLIEKSSSQKDKQKQFL